MLGAMNDGMSMYNDELEWKREFDQKKKTMDKKNSELKLKEQEFQHNALLNPDILKKAKLEVTRMEQQNQGFTNKTNAFDTFMNNPSLSSATKNNMYGMRSGVGYDPTKNAELEMKDALMSLIQAQGGMNEGVASYKGQQYQGDTLNVLETILKALDPQANNRVVIPTLDDAGTRTGSSLLDKNSGEVTQVNMGATDQPSGQLDINHIMNKAVQSTYGTDEFNDENNRAMFINKANEVYQALISKNVPHDQAIQKTREILFKSLKLDDDASFGFLSDKELDYVPVINNDADYLSLPVGTKYVDDQGNIRVKK